MVDAAEVSAALSTLLDSLDSDGLTPDNAQQLNAALSDKPTRTTLAADKEIRQQLHNAILAAGTGQAPYTSSGEDADSTKRERRVARSTAIAAGAAKFKLDFAAADAALGEAGGIDSVKAGMDKKGAMEQLARKRTADAARNKEEDERLLGLIREELVERSGAVRQAGGDDDTDEERQRQTLLTTLECLTYLTISPINKDTVAKDGALLSSLGSVLKIGGSRRSVFPSRHPDSAPAKPTSSYDLDPLQSSFAMLSTIDSDRYDTALQYGLASVLHNLVAHPARRSDEEKQMEKLKAMASAKGDSTSMAEQEERKRLESDDETEKRSARVLDAGLVSTLVSIATAGLPPVAQSKTNESAAMSGVNPSEAVRKAVAGTLHSLLTKQDKLVRGKVVQQGGLKAILALCGPVYRSLAAAASAGESDKAGLFSTSQPDDGDAADLVPFQCLAKVLVTADPVLLFGSTANCTAAIPLLSALYLCPHADRLQTFEAALALTNLSSLSPEIASLVAAASMTTATARKEERMAKGERVRDRVETQLLSDDHELTRRASVELLCNLLQDEAVWTRWSGEDAGEGGDATGSLPPKGGDGDAKQPSGRVKTRLHVLVSLLSVDDLPTRLGSAACLATLSASPTACAVLLQLKTSSLSWLLRCLDLPSPFSGEEEDDAEAAEEDETDWTQTTPLLPPFLPPADSEEGQDARAQINRLGLALRTLSCVLNLVRFLLFLREQDGSGSGGATIREITSDDEAEDGEQDAQAVREKLTALRVGEGVKMLLLQEVGAAQQSGGEGSGGTVDKRAKQTEEYVQAQRTQAINVAVEVLKLCKEAGLDV